MTNNTIIKTINEITDCLLNLNTYVYDDEGKNLIYEFIDIMNLDAIALSKSLSNNQDIKQALEIIRRDIDRINKFISEDINNYKIE